MWEPERYAGRVVYDSVMTTINLRLVLSRNAHFDASFVGESE